MIERMIEYSSTYCTYQHYKFIPVEKSDSIYLRPKGSVPCLSLVVVHCCYGRCVSTKWRQTCAWWSTRGERGRRWRWWDGCSFSVTDNNCWCVRTIRSPHHSSAVSGGREKHFLVKRETHTSYTPIMTWITLT